MTFYRINWDSAELEQLKRSFSYGAFKVQTSAIAPGCQEGHYVTGSKTRILFSYDEDGIHLYNRNIDKLPFRVKADVKKRLGEIKSLVEKL